MERLVGEYAFIAEKVGYSTNTIARVFSKVTLTFGETTESKKPITLRKFADAYTEEELR
jgi:hypothetical protein